MRNARSQSAMEYLMTYGWAILIIAVVLGALYSLGVFNAVNFMPKVPGGGCHVFRPNGQGTSWNVNLVGSCNNALPQYVAQFNGQSSYITLGQGSEVTGNQLTMEIWADQYGNTSTTGIYNNAGAAVSQGDTTYISPCASGHPRAYITANSVPTAINAGLCHALGTWNQYVLVYNGSELAAYVDGVQEGGNAPISGNVESGTQTIGSSGTTWDTFNGSIANVQIYNTSLTANQVQYLYNEGIGGVPISPQYLVGWWPLNGDTNDYSGNNNNGAATAVTFNGTWTSGYNVP